MSSGIWIPRHKWELVEWLVKEFPEGSFKNKSKKQLFAIYMNVRRRNG